MKRFFTNINTIEELKKEYRRLAFMHHPDRGGNIEDMQALNNEYDEMLKKLADTANEDVNEMEFAENFKEVIEQLIHCQGLEIEICGSWLWVSGNTKEHKETLKSLGFKWRSKKQMWSLGETSGKGHKEWDMDKIRGTFGSQKVNPNFRPELN